MWDQLNISLGGVSWLHLFNYINEVRASEGCVEDNVILLAVRASNYWGCTAQLSTLA